MEEDGDRVRGGEYSRPGLRPRDGAGKEPRGLWSSGAEDRDRGPRRPLFCREETRTGCPVDHREERPGLQAPSGRVVGSGRRDRRAWAGCRPAGGPPKRPGGFGSRQGAGSRAAGGAGPEQQLSRPNWAARRLRRSLRRDSPAAHREGLPGRRTPRLGGDRKA